MTAGNTHRIAAALAIGALVLALPVTAQTYTATDLGTLPGGFISGGFGLNDFGRAVGTSNVVSASMHGFYHDGLPTEIPPLPTDSQSHAFDVNASGQVAAMSYNLGDLVRRGLMWQSGTTSNLGGIAPHGINSSAVVVGYLSMLDANFGWVEHAAVWQTGVVSDLGTLGGHFSYAAAVSDDNHIVGWSFLADDTTHHATQWYSGVPRDLGTLGGTNSLAYDINNFRQVVGVADTAAGQPHAFTFLLDAAGNVLTRTDLGVLGGGYSYAYGINDSGDVVGTSDAVAFVWRSGTMQDLNSLLTNPADWRLDAAYAINSQGQIVGSGLHLGRPHAFLLTPGAGCRGDANCDVFVSWRDINFFVAGQNDNVSAWTARFLPGSPTCPFSNLDTNTDGHVSWRDIAQFVQLMNTTCP